MHVDPLVVEQKRIPAGALVYEADLLVDVPGAGVEVVDLVSDAGLVNGRCSILRGSSRMPSSA